MGKFHYLEAFNIQRMLLIWTGLWPKKEYGLCYKLYGFFTSFLLQAALLMPCMVVAFYPSMDVAHGSYLLFSSITVFTYGIKVIVLYLKADCFYAILDDLQQPLFTNYSSDLDVYIKNAVFVSNTARKMIQYPCVIFIGFITAFPIIENHSQRPLPYDLPININELSLPIYLTIYFAQVIAASLCACNNGNLDTLTYSFITLGTAQLKILESNLKTSATLSKSGGSGQNLERFGSCDEDVLKRLEECVKHHIAICKYVEKLEEMFTYIILAQFLTSVAIICITGFSFLVIPVTNLMFLVSIIYFFVCMVEITMYCTFGDELMIQSLKIRDACYMSEWNNCGPKIRKALLIIMERSKRPLGLTAGKFADLSRVSLVMVYKSSFSYFAVLRKLYSSGE